MASLKKYNLALLSKMSCFTLNIFITHYEDVNTLGGASPATAYQKMAGYNLTNNISLFKSNCVQRTSWTKFCTAIDLF